MSGNVKPNTAQPERVWIPAVLVSPAAYSYVFIMLRDSGELHYTSPSFQRVDTKRAISNFRLYSPQSQIPVSQRALQPLQCIS